MATVKLSNAINRLAIKTKNLINAIKTELQKKASMINLEENVDYTDYDTFLAKFKALGGQLGSRVRIITQTNGTYELTVVLNPATNADTFTANGQYQNNSATAPVVNIGTFIKNATNQEWKPVDKFPIFKVSNRKYIRGDLTEQFSMALINAGGTPMLAIRFFGNDNYYILGEQNIYFNFDNVKKEVRFKPNTQDRFIRLSDDGPLQADLYDEFTVTNGIKLADYNHDIENAPNITVISDVKWMEKNV